MGILSAVGKEREIVRESKRTKMIVITLEAEGQRLDVTLFGEYVDVLKSFFRHAPLEHAVIVIQYAKVKMFQDQNDFLDMSKTRVIANLKESNEDGSYVVYGTIVAVNNESDWWYLACKCNRAVKPDGAIYLIKLSVKDDSGTTTFVLFDREASNILNISCAELMEKSDLAGSFENPKEFDDLLLGKTYIFKVEVRVMNRGQHEHSFRVSKVCHDDSIKKKYLESIHANNSKATANRAIPVYSVEEEFLNRTLAKTIESLKDCTEDGEYAVYGTIKGVDGGADWFIPTCRCGSEVIPRNGFYYCSDCKKCVVNVIPRYRIKARVNDASDSATFVIFESLGCLLLHKSCSEMLKLSEDVNNQMFSNKCYLKSHLSSRLKSRLQI
ncbi:unnamed protein product [Cuscuta campestris]|uniref:Replication factor A C-terminal domain-containing protein n=1 Tax=Cuscuta campestris TaxID=132261 RepID=A0A484NN89_9ASTE|nr:unnamed protein product [Cuscuta campestris]